MCVCVCVGGQRREAREQKIQVPRSYKTPEPDPLAKLQNWARAALSSSGLMARATSRLKGSGPGGMPSSRLRATDLRPAAWLGEGIGREGRRGEEWSVWGGRVDGSLRGGLAVLLNCGSSSSPVSSH